MDSLPSDSTLHGMQKVVETDSDPDEEDHEAIEEGITGKSGATKMIRKKIDLEWTRKYECGKGEAGST